MVEVADIPSLGRKRAQVVVRRVLKFALDVRKRYQLLDTCNMHVIVEFTIPFLAASADLNGPLPVKRIERIQPSAQTSACGA